MNAFLIPNSDKPKTVDCLGELTNFLRINLCNFMFEEKYSMMYNYEGAVFLPRKDALARADFIITIGGDGTLLAAAADAAETSTPIIGINVGRLGFLTLVEPTGISELAEILTGRFSVDERMMLELSYQNASGETLVRHVLNDIVASRDSTGKTADIHAVCDGKTFSEFRADGIILATPTGSTAYSLSAGGIAVDPAVESVLFTPICAHSLKERPVVLSAEKTIKIINESYANCLCLAVAADGEMVTEIKPGESITVKRSPLTTKLISLQHKDFYEILTQKMMRGW